MESVKIVLLCVVAAIVYGILHDQVTARVCVEYFTIGHSPVFATDSPTLLAIGWGIIATWWVGLVLGVPAAVAARVGSNPKLRAIELVRPIIVLMAIMGLCSVVAGIVGYFVAKAGGVGLVEPLASRLPVDRHNVFLADLWAHLAAYATGFLGGMTLCIWLVVKRWRRSSARTSKAP